MKIAKCKMQIFGKTSFIFQFDIYNLQ